MPAPIDLAGCTFGRLVVEELLLPRSRRGRLWRCRCVCGAEVTVCTASLRAGNTQSCGCLAKAVARKRVHDLTGQVFGRLEVLFLAEPISGRTAWTCRCSCGAEVAVLRQSLTQGLQQTCGKPGCYQTARPVPDVRCPSCPRVFAPRGNQKFCSRECRLASLRKPRDGQTCPCCGEWKDRTRCDAVYCSQRCQRRAMRLREGERLTQSRIRQVEKHWRNS